MHPTYMDCSPLAGTCLEYILCVVFCLISGSNHKHKYPGSAHLENHFGYLTYACFQYINANFAKSTMLNCLNTTGNECLVHFL